MVIPKRKTKKLVNYKSIGGELHDLWQRFDNQISG